MDIRSNSEEISPEAEAQATGPFSPPALTLPQGGGAIRGIDEKFNVNLATGSGSITIPITTSPGRSGFGPTLSLAYDSGAGNGPFGLGWSLSIPNISRKTAKGLPRYNDQDTFLLSGSEDLVPSLFSDNNSWSPHISEQTVSGETYQVERFRPRIEGLFSRIERWTRLTDGDVHWRSITRENVTSLYGQTMESRIADPVDPQRIFSWLLCESYDDKGNAILYRYKAEDSSGISPSLHHERNRTDQSRSVNRYIKRVSYGNRTPHQPEEDLTLRTDWMFEILFDYGEGHYIEFPPDGEARIFADFSLTETAPWPLRQDPFSVYRAGFEVRSYRFCRQVHLVHHFPTELGIDDYLVRSTSFTYGEDPILTKLTAVTQSGYLHESADTFLCRSLPPTEFEYSQVPLQNGLQPEDHSALELRTIEAADLENMPIGLNAPYTFVDLDGEGLSGILTEQGNQWFFKPNRGSGSFGPMQAVGQKPSLANLNSGSQQLLDLAGDGQLDLVLLNSPTPGFYERTTDQSWHSFRPFETLPNLNWNDPNLRFVDLTGDGHADILITEDNLFTWHPSLAEAGYDAPELVPQPWDEEEGPRLVFNDGAQSIYLSDMSGDGLVDLVRIRNGEICYWPSLGYGRFGAKVSMDNPPIFESTDLFDQDRIRLADIDGSGITDIIYLGRDRIDLYYNEAGNGWQGADQLPAFPQVDSLTDVRVTDLLGNGTACLVWSSPLPGDSRVPLRYVDLMQGIKPHLLIRSRNNLGAETVVQYASSTKFYLADREAGTPWVTKLPFPVHVVEKRETFDHISRNRFVTRYAYHHGYFDGQEREFRGFGRVDQIDTEAFATLTESDAFPTGENVDASSHIPPALTKSWFHVGAYVEPDGPRGTRISQLFADEYYREPGLSAVEWQDYLLPDTVLPDGTLSAEEERLAVRALKGSMLRQEIYALDDSPQAPHPYLVTEQNFTLERVQPAQSGHDPVFFTHPRETLTHHYERNPDDPRTDHEVVLEVDPFGNVLRVATLSYGRRQADANLDPADQAVQARTLATTTESTYTNRIDLDPAPGQTAAYRTPLMAETETFELHNLSAPASGPYYSFAEIEAATQSAVSIPYHANPTPGTLQKRPVEHGRTYYRPNDCGVAQNDPLALLDLGTLESLALPGESYQLALTPEHAALVFEDKISDPIFQEGGYVHTHNADGSIHTGWWVPSGRIFFSPDIADSPAVELAHAQSHFFLPLRFRDPFAAVTTIAYDSHDLLPTESRDPVDNLVQVENNYRLLKPQLLTDPNQNRTELLFDVLGMVSAAAVMGKATENLGDSLAGLSPQLTRAEIDTFLADPRGPSAAQLLGNATSRLIYDEAAYYRSGEDQPPVAATIVRETHVSDLQAGEMSQLQVSLAYSDGFGRVIQEKRQAEPGPLEDGGPAVDPRWVGSGWTIFNNKGNPVRHYEPFFDDTHDYRYGHTVGVSPILFYDPLGRNVATLYPNQTWEKVLFAPWQEARWDLNDTVLLDPTTDPDVNRFFTRLPSDDYSPTWHAQRIAGQLGPDERAAATKAAPHAATPVFNYFDGLNRTFLTVADNGTEQFTTRNVFDIEGKPIEIEDGLGRLTIRYARTTGSTTVTGYDMLSNLIFQHSMDAGMRWMLLNVVGNPHRLWDERGHTQRTVYDPLQRPTDRFIANAGGERLVERIVYGEAQGAALNHRSQIFQLLDGAGQITNSRYDFKGNLLQSTRQYVTDYRTEPNWSTNPALEPTQFATQSTFDALSRPTTITQPDGSVTGMSYNEANLLEAVDVNLQGGPNPTRLVGNFSYNAKGQRESVEYGNGVTTTYAYDPATFHLTRLLTLRGATPLQDLHYVYDPVGNITSIVDGAQQTVYFNNAVVSPRADYAYDPLYRLTVATGREHIGQAGGPQETTWTDQFRISLPHPTDGAAMRTYSEAYTYDEVGNILDVNHTATNGRWTRTYLYNEASPLDNSADNNRLTSTTIGAATPHGYTYDAHGNMVSMPHLPQMVWDCADRLRQVDLQGGGNAYYQYDASGQRVRKVIDRQSGQRQNERFYLGTYERYREFNGNGSTVTLERESLHVMDDLKRIALIDTRTQGNDGSARQLIRYQLDNHLGSAALELDNAAQIISYEEYYPYGGTAYRAVRSTTEVPRKRYQYTGKERDGETGLHYYGARYYASWMGRWISPDPAGQVDGLNLYEYVNGQVITFIDEQGFKKKKRDDDANRKWRKREIASAKTELMKSKSFKELDKNPAIQSLSPKEEFDRQIKKIKKEIKAHIKSESRELKRPLTDEEKKNAEQYIMSFKILFTTEVDPGPGKPRIWRFVKFDEWGGGQRKAKAFRKENKIELYGKGENNTQADLVHDLTHEYSHLFDPASDAEIDIEPSPLTTHFKHIRGEIFAELFGQLLLCEINGNSSCRIDSLKYGNQEIELSSDVQSEIQRIYQNDKTARQKAVEINELVKSRILVPETENNSSSP